jgi:hypothetical protein
MSALRDAAQQALEALEEFGTHYGHCPRYPTWARPELQPPCNCGLDSNVAALRAALAQQEQEPVAWQVHPFDYGIGSEGVYAMTQRPDQVKAWERKGWTVQPLYTTPPRREWRSLSEEEIEDLRDDRYFRFARAIEAALKEKNA